MTITLEEYESWAKGTHDYHDYPAPQFPMYPYVGLAGESGEVLDEAKRALREDGGVITPQRREHILDECGDVLWNLAAVVADLGSSLADLAERNRTKVETRAVTGTTNGRGSSR